MKKLITVFSTLAIILVLVAVFRGQNTAFNGFFLFGGIAGALMLIEAKRERNARHRAKVNERNFKHWER